jgi:ATP/maltotriose-dependent transcriptional regulator MalT/DNA-binding transcriptional ArsR family regulator
LNPLEVLSNKTNLEILKLLKGEATYPRRLASLLSMREQKVVPRLRSLEEAGLLSSSWKRIGNKNVKLYEVTTDKVELLLGPEGVDLVVHPKANRQAASLPLYVAPKISWDDSFVGRERELELLASKTRFIIIEGIGGIGKSSLLQSFAHLLPTGYRIFWHAFKETDSFNYVMTRLASFLADYDYLDLLEYLKWAGNEDSTKLDLALKGLNRPEYVLIFDDYQRQHDVALNVFLEHLQQHLTKAKVIVASRERPGFLLASPQALEIALEGLSEEECRLYLEKKKVALSDKRMALVYRKTAGHPLSLVVMSSILRSNKEKLDEISSLPTIGDLASEIIDSLGEDEREVLLRASIFRNPIPVEGVLTLVRSRRVRACLHSLERKLILRRSDGSYQLHELIREGCYARIDSPEELHGRAGQWLLSRGTPQDTLEGLYHMIKANQYSSLNEVMMQELAQERFHFVEEGYGSVLLDILSPVETDRLKPRDACCLLCVQAKALTNVQAWRKAGELLSMAKRIATELRDEKLLSCVYKTMGNYHIMKGDMAKGERHLIMSSDLLRQTGDSESLAKIYLNLAKLHFLMGDVRGSLNYIDSRDNVRR